MSLNKKILWLLMFCAALALWLALAARHEPKLSAVQYPELASLGFCRPLATVVEARCLRPPADDSLRVQGTAIDWAWVGPWRCRGIAWRGLCWRRRLLLWSVRPDEAAMANAVLQWSAASSEETPAWPGGADEPRCMTPQLLALAAVLALLRWRWSAMQPVVRARRRLRRDSAVDIPADELAQIVRAGNGGAWAVQVPAGAKVSPVLTAALRGLLAELATQLDRERYAGVVPTPRQRYSRLQLARHCLELAHYLPAPEGAKTGSRKDRWRRRIHDLAFHAPGGNRT